MCYAKPGPRCSQHCREALEKARGAYQGLATRKADLADPQQLTRLHQAKERLAAAKSRYDRTPEGKKSLREEADTVLAGQEGLDPATESVQERLSYSAALLDYADHGIEARKVQMRKLRAHEWNQTMIEERLGGAVLRAEREYEAAAADVARTDKDPAARARFQQASDALVYAHDQWYTTAEGQRDVKGAVRSLVAEAEECPVARQRQRLLKEAKELKAAQQEGWRTRKRQLAEYHAIHDVRARLDQEMATHRAKDVAPKRPRPGATVPAQRTAEPAAPARAGEGDAWRADPKVQRPQTVVLRAAG